jgi:hypothetical protein
MIPQRTSSTKGKGDRAVKEERERFRSEIESFQKTYACMKDAEAAVARFVKKMRRAHPMFSVEPRYLTVVETRRGRGRPRKDGSNILTEERVVVELGFAEDDGLREALWKSKEMIVLVSNVPSREDDPDRGMDAEDLIRLYVNQWRVEGGFCTIKRPAIADRLFLEKESRAEALVQVFCMGVLVRGLIQLLIRKGIGEIPDEGLPPYGVDGRALQRNVTHEYFIKKVQNILVLYFPATGTFHYCNEAARTRAEFFIRAMGIEPHSLFGGS